MCLSGAKHRRLAILAQIPPLETALHPVEDPAGRQDQAALLGAGHQHAAVVGVDDAHQLGFAFTFGWESGQ